ncbi:MAG: hypothetical protein FJZ16_00865 [Candidatus Omnitrophica bacterium]|nr:hypothetical protein [Candidatus Omnitrophota bacterium]
MKKQLSFLDIIRFIIAFVVFFNIAFALEDWGNYLLSNVTNFKAQLLLGLFFVELLPTFLGMLISLIFSRWNYKVVTGMIFIFIVLLNYIFMFPSFIENWITLLFYTVKLSMGMIGGVGAILIWNILKDKLKSKSTKVSIESLKIAKTKPKTSMSLLLLSLFSIPLTYITMFFSAFITLGVSSLLLYLILQLPRIPIVVIIAAVLAPVIGLWAGIRALWVMFFPPLQFEPATILDMSKYPTLRKIIDNVCSKIRTQKPSVVVLHSEPTFFVMQGKLSTFEGIVKGRILAIGLPVLKELNCPELSSVLAHEFAHFSGRDTMYSTIVSPVYRGITASMNEISGATEGSSSDNNAANLMQLLLLPSQIFLGLFLQYFATIEKILSRSLELRADWIAANLFGANNFSSALTKVTTIQQHFDESSLDLAINSEKDFFNKHSQLLWQNSYKLEEYRKKELSIKEEDFDSHPCFSVRLLNLPDNTKENLEYLSESQNLKNELLEKEEELSKRYTETIKKYKEMMDILASRQQQQTTTVKNE